MARKAQMENMRKKRSLAARFFAKRQELKKKVVDRSLPFEERSAARDELGRLPKNSSPVRLRNRCHMSGRARGYLRKFGLSRICFREMALYGTIPGFVKASW